MYGQTSKCTAISARKLKDLLIRGAVSHCIQLKALPLSSNSEQSDTSVHALQSDDTAHQLPEVQHLLAQYSHLFQEPSTLPPERQYDHNITLIPGA